MSAGLGKGRWVQRGMTRVWVQADDAATRSRYRAVVAERYSEPTWFAAPGVCEPATDQLAGRRRLAECVAEAEGLRDVREVAG